MLSISMGHLMNRVIDDERFENGCRYYLGVWDIYIYFDVEFYLQLIALVNSMISVISENEQFHALKICWIYIYLVSHNTGEFPSSVKKYSAKKKGKKRYLPAIRTNWKCQCRDKGFVQRRVWKGSTVPLFEVPFFSSMTDKNRVHAPRMTKDV